MTELKTLKDFKFLAKGGKLLSKETPGRELLFFVGIKELKQEAIKWVKEAMIKFNSMGGDTFHRFIFDEIDYNILELYAAIKEKKHFFNITKEDLK